MSNYSESYFDESNQNASWYKVFNLIPEKSKVLDIGCSSGNFGAVLIERKKCEVYGIEPDKQDAEEAARKLKKVWQLNVETDDLETVGIGKYDAIYFGDVIEHLVHPIDTLLRVKPLLKKGGAILFSIPNMGHIGVRLALLEGNFDYTETGLTDKTHLHFYTQKEVHRVFEEAGYKIDVLDFVSKDYPKALLKKHLEKLGLHPKDKFYKMMSATDASAFQFVGKAQPSKVRNHKLQNFGPIDMFESFFEDTKQNYENRIKELETKLEYAKAHPYRSAASHIKQKTSKANRRNK